MKSIKSPLPARWSAEHARRALRNGRSLADQINLPPQLVVLCLFSPTTRRCFFHFRSQSKALRERWLLDGAPAEEETQKRLQEDEVKTKLLEQVILRSATPKKISSAPDGEHTAHNTGLRAKSNMCECSRVYFWLERDALLKC